MNIQWYPGHMTKARRQLKNQLKAVDLVIEVVDARAPFSSLNPDFEDLFSEKLRFYILNKEDLADPVITKKWLTYFKGREIPSISYSVKDGNIALLKKKINECAVPVLERYAMRGMKKTLRCVIVGIPNVGKSAILNRLSGEKKLKEGNRPGVTKSLQWARIDEHLEIMDTPGLLWPKFEEEKTGAVVALIGSIKLDILDEEALAYYLIGLLKNTEPELIKKRYHLEDLEKNDFELLEDICKKRGFLLKGGLYDTERGAKTVLDEFKNGKLGRLSLEKPE